MPRMCFKSRLPISIDGGDSLCASVC